MYTQSYTTHNPRSPAAFQNARTCVTTLQEHSYKRPQQHHTPYFPSLRRSQSNHKEVQQTEIFDGGFSLKTAYWSTEGFSNVEVGGPSSRVSFFSSFAHLPLILQMPQNPQILPQKFPRHRRLSPKQDKRKVFFLFYHTCVPSPSSAGSLGRAPGWPPSWHRKPPPSPDPPVCVLRDSHSIPAFRATDNTKTNLSLHGFSKGGGWAPGGRRLLRMLSSQQLSTEGWMREVGGGQRKKLPWAEWRCFWRRRAQPNPDSSVCVLWQPIPGSQHRIGTGERLRIEHPNGVGRPRENSLGGGGVASLREHQGSLLRSDCSIRWDPRSGPSHGRGKKARGWCEAFCILDS